MPQCTHQGSDCLKALIQSLSAAQPGQLQPPSLKESLHHLILLRSHNTSWARKESQSKVQPHMPGSKFWCRQGLFAMELRHGATFNFMWFHSNRNENSKIRLQNDISLSLQMHQYSCGTWNFLLRTTKLWQNRSSVTTQASKRKVIRKDLGLWCHKKKCN